jgi:hypothetical protein
MNPKIKELLERIRQLEDQIDQEVQRRRTELHADFANKRVKFEQGVKAQQRRFKMGLVKYVLHAKIRHLISAPFIYSMIFPLLLLDLFVTVYQVICFPLYRIPRVRRSDYMIFDRTHLAYLNLVEKINCAYCSYGNGLAAYLREIAARTERYWCPIKHARRTLQSHAYYSGFVDYGDAEAYHRELQILRDELSKLDSDEKQDPS